MVRLHHRTKASVGIAGDNPLAVIAAVIRPMVVAKARLSMLLIGSVAAFGVLPVILRRKPYGSFQPLGTLPASRHCIEDCSYGSCATEASDSC
jgi:hypothetical protein